MNKNVPLRDACMEAMDYCFGMYGEVDSVFDEVEFEFYLNATRTPSIFKRIIFHTLVFTADMVLSL